MSALRGCLVGVPAGLLLWVAIGAAAWWLLACAEPPIPDPVYVAPEPCEYPRALNYLGDCTLAPSARDEWR